MKKLFFAGYFWCVLCITVSAQKEVNRWYFGNQAGLDFNPGSPAALTDGQVGEGYGSACVSDENGNLLFYTDGETVWNRQHSIMQNGNSLSGDKSSSQSALIVQHPDNDNLYYVFTTAPYNTNGFQYSIVDLTQDGGLGGVSSKNNLLFAPSTEKVTAAVHANNIDLWILAHEKNTDAFYAYLIDESGLNTTPVISHIGNALTGFAAGHLKFNTAMNQVSSTLGNGIEIYDFDNSTGIVSNPMYISISGTTNGIEYSPDRTKLYYTSFHYGPSNNTLVNQVYQLDILAGGMTEIENSSTLVFTDTVSTTAYQFIAAMQIGPDKKIYVLSSSNQYLDIIENPNEAGANCTYTKNVLYLGGKATSAGLPNFPPVYNNKNFTILNNCSDTATIFKLNKTTNIASVLWDFDDPASNSNTSTLLKPSHVFTNAGDYDVNLVIHYTNGNTKTISKTITIQQSPEAAPVKDTGICDKQDLGLQLPHPEYSFLWSNGTTNSSFTIQSEGMYWVQSMLGACKRRDTFSVRRFSLPEIKPSGELLLCYNDTATLTVTGDNNSYQWNNGSTNNFITVSQAGTYSVVVINHCGLIEFSKTIKNISCCTPSIPNLITANNDSKNEELVISCIEDGQWKLELYNRWGDRVFESNDYRNELKGQELEEGVYYYSLSKEGRSSYRGWVEVMK